MKALVSELFSSAIVDVAGAVVGVSRSAIHQLLNIILKLGILVLLLVSTMPYEVIVRNYT
jgi:hypothetical protein